MAEEGELWVEGAIPSLQEKEDEKVLVQVEEPQVQALSAIGVDMGENCIEGGQLILIEGRVNEQETSTNVAYLDNIFIEEEDEVRAELKVDDIEHIDFIGVDNFDVHSNYKIIDFFNKLRDIELNYGLTLDELRFAKNIHSRVEDPLAWLGKTILDHVTVCEMKLTSIRLVPTFAL
ncbi:hypothetical protein LguiB_036400 [Lonicera macranthoides]